MPKVNEIRLLTIYESQDGYESEYISVDANTNIPYQKWFDGGNMWGNRTLQITWKKVESFDPVRLNGINEHNWRNYI